MMQEIYECIQTGAYYPPFMEILQIPQAIAQKPVTALTPPPSCFAFFDSGIGAPGQGFSCIADYINMLTNVLIGFGASIALILLMYNGIQYIVSSVSPGGSTDSAKKGISSALMGLGISLLVYLIINTIVSTLTQTP